jgi:D-alanyl-D-alanine carboxypeptidase/D-alanyl-D-alanine-endopeptidase (penicillin-binding protein 4)
MKKIVLIVTILIEAVLVDGQTVSKKLLNAVKNLEADDQLKSGMLALNVIEQKSGLVLFDENGSIGLPVASSQKVLTSVASLDILGTGYRYQTALSYTGNIHEGTLNGTLFVDGSGDPTLGSWRFENTKEQVILNKWVSAIKKVGIQRINGAVVIDNKWGTYSVPGGWIWDDIGNYYGAGATALNWRENQYDLKLKSGKATGDKVSIASTVPNLYDVDLISELTTGKPGSGDNAYIYLAPYGTVAYVRGTIPPNENAFTVSGSFPDPAKQMTRMVEAELKRQGIELIENRDFKNDKSGTKTDLILHQSPPLDSINHWFLRKSINLYGEALVKTLGFERKKEGTTEAGVNVVKSFWKDRGIDPAAINMKDGSGLSPQNRITAQALVKVMQYARSQPYFSSFYNALPEFNGIKMKSGTIGGTKSFTGYLNGYTFAIVVNNYNGPSAEIVRKIYKVLDELK